MTIIVEDGTVVAGAESYATVAYADAYHAGRGNTSWDALDDEVKEAALRKATDYMIQAYRPRWKGYRKDANQVLDWPRTFVYLEPFVRGVVGTYPYLVSDTIVPEEVKRVCVEYALRASTADLNPDLERAEVSVTVGPISTTYDTSDPQSKRYRSLDMMLSPYLCGSANNAKLSRA